MEGILYNRRMAYWIAAILTAAGLLLGCRRSLMQIRNTAADYFNTGNNGYSIQADLEERAAAAFNMTTVAKRYLPEDDDEIGAVISAREALLTALLTEDDPSSMYTKNSALDATVERLSEKLEQSGLDETDENYRHQILAVMQSKNSTISHDPYNKMADDFNHKLKRFPASILSKLVFVGPLELFGPK